MASKFILYKHFSAILRACGNSNMEITSHHSQTTAKIYVYITPRNYCCTKLIPSVFVNDFINITLETTLTCSVNNTVVLFAAKNWVDTNLCRRIEENKAIA